ncbi:unnamed protein product [Closterium sp. Naga37s-1]|nr:unnamed protein product [Closterium sp. Naga37s-1]
MLESRPQSPSFKLSCWHKRSLASLRLSLPLFPPVPSSLVLVPLLPPPPPSSPPHPHPSFPLLSPDRSSLPPLPNNVRGVGRKEEQDLLAFGEELKAAAAAASRSQGKRKEKMKKFLTERRKAKKLKQRHGGRGDAEVGGGGGQGESRSADGRALEFPEKEVVAFGDVVQEPPRNLPQPRKKVGVL